MINILIQYGLVCLNSFSCFLYLNSYFNIISVSQELCNVFIHILVLYVVK